MNLVIPIVVVCLVIAALWYVMVLHRGKQSLSNAILLDDLEKFSRLIPNITQYDNKHRKEPSLLIRAADRNAVSILSFLIDKKVDVNAKDTNRLTPLMYAAQNNGNDKQFLCIKRLLSAGADINARDNNGRTALMYAAAHAAHPKLLIPLLLAHGADVHAVDEYGMTAPKYWYNFRTGDKKYQLRDETEVRNIFRSAGNDDVSLEGIDYTAQQRAMLTIGHVVVRYV